jgi:hypothetical protein
LRWWCLPLSRIRKPATSLRRWNDCMHDQERTDQRCVSIQDSIIHPSIQDSLIHPSTHQSVNQILIQPHTIQSIRRKQRRGPRRQWGGEEHKENTKQHRDTSIVWSHVFEDTWVIIGTHRFLPCFNPVSLRAVK